MKIKRKPYQEKLGRFGRTFSRFGFTLHPDMQLWSPRRPQSSVIQIMIFSLCPLISIDSTSVQKKAHVLFYLIWQVSCRLHWTYKSSYVLYYWHLLNTDCTIRIILGPEQYTRVLITLRSFFASLRNIQKIKWDFKNRTPAMSLTRHFIVLAARTQQF